VIIIPDFLSRVFGSAAEALEQLRRNPIHLLPEADLQSHLFMALFNRLRDDLDSDRIGLHCQPRFFPSPDDRSGKRYPACLFSITATTFLIHNVFLKRAFKFTVPVFRLRSSCADYMIGASS
jgi:hypothetical protein